MILADSDKPSDADLRQTLTWLTERFVRNLGNDEVGKAYLLENGIDNEGILASYRMGSACAGVLNEMTPTQKMAARQVGLIPKGGTSTLVKPGVFIPTFDPADLTVPVGIIKQSYAQNKHQFASSAVGIGAPFGINDHAKIILADNPLLAFRLTQMGVKAVAIVETTDVLPPLSGWLRQKELILVSYKKDKLAAYSKALSEIGCTAAVAHLQGDFQHSPPESLDLLGINRATVKEPAPPATGFLLRDIALFAQARLENGEGLQAIKKLAADADFIAVYGMGFLPSDFRSALPSDSRRSLVGDKIANCIIVPAYDENDNVVDLLSARAYDFGTTYSLWEAPEKEYPANPSDSDLGVLPLGRTQAADSFQSSEKDTLAESPPTHDAERLPRSSGSDRPYPDAGKTGARLQSRFVQMGGRVPKSGHPLHGARHWTPTTITFEPDAERPRPSTQRTAH